MCGFSWLTLLFFHWAKTSILFSHHFTGSVAGPSVCGYMPPAFTWPLGELIGTKQLVPGTSSSGARFNTGIGTGSPQLDYNATTFNSSQNSRVELSIGATTAFNDDFSFQFFFYAESDGILMHFQVQSCALLNWIHFRFRCGSAAVPVNWNVIVSHHILIYFRMLYIVWSLVRRRVNRRLTRLQTMHNVLKKSKTLKTVAVRLRFGCGYFFNLLMFSTVYTEQKKFSQLRF